MHDIYAAKIAKARELLKEDDPVSKATAQELLDWVNDRIEFSLTTQKRHARFLERLEESNDREDF